MNTTALLKNKFNAEILESIEKAKKLGYCPTRFIGMLHEHSNNAYEVVQRIATKDITAGLQELYKQGRLDLSVEATMIKPMYRGLFPTEIIKICERKLKKLGYN